MKRHISKILAIVLLSFSLMACSTNESTERTINEQESGISQGGGSFIFDSDDYEPLNEKSVKVWYYNPDSTNKNLPVVFVLHGVNRNGDDYRNNWIDLADEYQLLIAAPEFSGEDYPGSEGYNLGNIFDEGGNPVPEEQWAFSMIEPLFDRARELSGNTNNQYYLFGHSAGSQFAHRFLMFKTGLRAKAVVAANAGWYTTPEFEVGFPYGLKGTGYPSGRLKQILGQNMVVLLGEDDDEPNADYLRNTPEAKAQGAHRLERGQNFYQLAGQKADSLDIDLAWRLETVPGVGHDNDAMADAAAELLFEGEAKN
jgi:hypothetical protein